MASGGDTSLLFAGKEVFSAQEDYYALQLKLAGGGDPASMFRCKKVIMHQLGQASITKQVSQELPWCNSYTF